MEMIGRRLEAELELFIMDVMRLVGWNHFKIGRDCDEKKDLQKSQMLLKQEPDQCQILLYTGHILENAYRFITGSKRRGRALGIGSEKMDVGH